MPVSSRDQYDNIRKGVPLMNLFKLIRKIVLRTLGKNITGLPVIGLHPQELSCLDFEKMSGG